MGKKIVSSVFLGTCELLKDCPVIITTVSRFSPAPSPGGVKRAEWLYTAHPAEKRYVLIAGEIASFFDPQSKDYNKGRLVQLYEPSTQQSFRAWVAHNTEHFNDKAIARIPSDAELLLVCHPQSLSPELRNKHPFPDLTGVMELRAAEFCYERHSGKMKKVFIPGINSNYEVWCFFPQKK